MKIIPGFSPNADGGGIVSAPILSLRGDSLDLAQVRVVARGRAYVRGADCYELDDAALIAEMTAACGYCL